MPAAPRPGRTESDEHASTATATSTGRSRPRGHAPARRPPRPRPVARPTRASRSTCARRACGGRSSRTRRAWPRRYASRPIGRSTAGTATASGDERGADAGRAAAAAAPHGERRRGAVAAPRGGRARRCGRRSCDAKAPTWSDEQQRASVHATVTRATSAAGGCALRRTSGSSAPSATSGMPALEQHQAARVPPDVAHDRARARSHR